MPPLLRHSGNVRSLKSTRGWLSWRCISVWLMRRVVCMSSAGGMTCSTSCTKHAHNSTRHCRSRLTRTAFTSAALTTPQHSTTRAPDKPKTLSLTTRRLRSTRGRCRACCRPLERWKNSPPTSTRPKTNASTSGWRPTTSRVATWMDRCGTIARLTTGWLSSACTASTRTSSRQCRSATTPMTQPHVTILPSIWSWRVGRRMPSTGTARPGASDRQSGLRRTPALRAI
mmetsp:Transcript_12318/g.29494  ORF Transcript_12318/g.29494 Transcript_12318/m.29494 type:complete len:228 (+) Transcript_12318:1149-1832(+)